MEKLNLRELKGAPLSIVLALANADKSAVSFARLAKETGYSDKALISGLDYLRSHQIITLTGNCYQIKKSVWGA